MDAERREVKALTFRPVAFIALSLRRNRFRFGCIDLPPATDRHHHSP